MTTTTTEIGLMGDPTSARRAAWWVAQGYVIGTYLDGVDGIWVDGNIPGAAAKIEDIKGEKRRGRPLTAALEAADFVPLLDPDLLPEPLRPIFSDPVELDGRLGALAPLRIAVGIEAVRRLPDFMTSPSDEGFYWLQNWLPAGHEAGQLLVRELKDAGVKLPAVTSMNVSGRPEITHQDEALEFSQEHGIRMLLNDPDPSTTVEGSYPILGIGPDGLSLLREGHFPGELFCDLLDYDEIDLTMVRPAKFPVSPRIRQEFAGRELHARALRQALLSAIHGV